MQKANWRFASRVSRISVSTLNLYLKTRNWMRQWLFGNSEQPLSMEQNTKKVIEKRILIIKLMIEDPYISKILQDRTRYSSDS